MLIRMFLDNIILSIVLLAGISLCAAEEDGYDYSRPAIGFSDGFGSQSQYVVSSTTPKPVAVYTVKPQASQYKAPTVSSSFAQSSTSFSRPASSVSQFGQYQTTQKYQAPIVSTVAKTQATSGQYVSGQYKAPVIAVTSKPQTSFGAFSQSSSKTSSGQYKAPVVAVTSKPQTNFGAFQGFSQTSSKTGSGQYVSGQYKAPVIAVTSKPQTSFAAFQGFGQSVTSKPQTSFGAFQGFGQSTNKISASSSGFAQYKPAVSNVAKPSFGGYQGFSQSSQSSSYSKPITTPKPIAKPAVTEYYSASSTASPVTVKPYVSSTSKPLVITPKPQTSFSAFQGFGQSKPAAPAFSQYGQQSIKPTVVTGQYQKPLVVVTPKPQTNAFQGFGQKVNQIGQYQKPSTGYSQSSSSFSQYQKPIVTSKPFTSFGNTGPSYLPPSKPQVSTIKVQPTVKPAISQYNFQSASSTVAPAVVKPLPTLPTPKPVIVTSKPQTVYNTFQGSVSKPQTSYNSFQGFGQSKPAVVQYQKPVVSTPIKSQSTFGSSQSFSQTSYQKPAATQTYYKPSTTAKPNLSYLPPKGQAVPAYQAPTVRPVTPKPQAAFSGFGQSVYQKPAVSTFNSFGQQTATKYTSSPVTAKPVVYTPATVKPVVYTPATFKPVVVTLKPQAAFSGFGQSVYQKPAVSTFNTFGQQTATKYTSSPVTAKPVVYTPATVKPVVYTPATFKPVVVTPKPQPAFTGFGQSVYQKPAVSTFNTFGQQTVTKYTSSPVTVKPVVYTPATVKPVVYTPATFKPVVVTPKPQPAFTGFGQSVYQKPAVSTFNSFGQQTATKYTSSPVTSKPVVYTPATFKPVVVTPKPQPAFTGFGQSVYQKPAVSTFNTFSQQTATKYTSSPITVKPVVYTPATVKPVVYTPAPVRPTLSPESLTYLPPKGVSAPLNAASSSGAVSQSFFDYASATANQVVDVAQEQKVGGFVTDEEAIKSLQSDSSIITNQVSSANTREQKVEGIDLRSSKLTATNEGQEEEEYFSGNFGRSKRQIYSNGGYQVNYPTQTGYLSYQGNPITTQQFGGVQPNSYQGVPYQQIAQAQSTVGIANNGVALYQGNYPAQQGATSYTAPNQDPYNFEGQYGYISSVEDQQQHIPQNYETQAQQQQQIPQNYETAASYTDAVNTQIPNDSPVHDPLPLNREEQQVRQVVEKPDSDFRNLQPGSYVGPHVNKNSDHEYNVFDYDQYSKDPAEDAESLS